MNKKEKLIEELKKPKWFVDTYLSADRINIIALLHSKSDAIPVSDYTKKISRYLHVGHRVAWITVDYDKTYKDLTQLFNEYLEEYEHDIWIRSVLAAMQLGLKIDQSFHEHDEWGPSNGLLLHLHRRHKYRINYEAPKLVSDEIWEMIDNNIIDGIKEIEYITKDKCGSIRGHKIKPDLHEASGFWRKLGGASFGLEHKLLENQAIMDVDWKDSLCIRPNKG